MADIRIGISGWCYKPWRGNFYPKGLLQKNELAFASRKVNSIEINGSFYALQTPQRYAGWYAAVPEDFIFSVKAPRYVTHILRLKQVEKAIANFFASGILVLRDKLGPILWQFPPSFKFDKQLFKSFLELLPTNTDEAFVLTGNSDINNNNLASRAYIPGLPFRHTVEICNESFRDIEFIKLLREYGVALVVADTAGKWPQLEDITSDFVYMRLHGDTELYRSGYSDQALDYWCQRIQLWRDGFQPDNAKLVNPLAKLKRKSRDIYCYFDNTDKLWAPEDAQMLLKKLNIDKGLQKDRTEFFAEEQYQLPL